MEQEVKSGNKKWFLIAVAIAGLSLIGLYWFTYTNHQGEASASELSESIEFVSWQDLTLGQTGCGLTVFKGTKIEKFYVTYEGVKPHPLFQGEKIILVKMGKPLENSEVLSGMSGSPVYFYHEGKWKLAGALGWGYGTFPSEEAIGGITPIQAMLNQEKTLGLTQVGQKLQARFKNSENLLEELSKPIFIGEFQLLPLNIQMISDPGELTNPKGSKIAKPRPGDAITVFLVKGKDYSGGVTCTVTYVKGNKFWACGHPLLGDGEVILPAYRAEIATSFKSHYSAFKLPARTREYVGYVSYDNAFALEGQIQELPPEAMLPINFEIIINKNGRVKKAHFSSSVMRHRIFSQFYIAGLARELINGLWSSKDRITTLSISTIDFYDRESINLFDTISFWSAADRTADFIGQLMDSDWDFRIKSVRIKTEIITGRKILFLDSYQIVNEENKIINEAKLCDKVKLVLGLRTADAAQQYTRVIPIWLEIPDEFDFEKIENKNLNIYIESGNDFEERGENSLLNHFPDNKEEFLQSLILNQRNPQKIYIQLVFPEIELDAEDRTTLEEMAEGDWLKAKNLEFLRLAKLSKRLVKVIELDPPLESYILDVKKAAELKLLPKPEEVKKKKKRLFIF